MKSLEAKQLKISEELLLIKNVFKLVSLALWMCNLTVNYLLTRSFSLICISVCLVSCLCWVTFSGVGENVKEDRHMHITRPVTTRNTGQLR